MRWLFVLLTGAGIAGCATQPPEPTFEERYAALLYPPVHPGPAAVTQADPTPDDLLRADYGASITSQDAERDIRLWSETSLKDPESARYGFSGEAVRGWWREYESTTNRFGWLYLFDVNAKNSYGGYAGPEAKAAIYRDGHYIAIVPSVTVSAFGLASR